MTENSGPEYDVVIIGAGVTGIYQLYRALDAGFSARLLEAGDGVGGTWFWNRYPEARFDSESYTYGYLFSKELWEEWEWSERFAGQPEIERYFNYVVDRFDLRKHIEFATTVTAAEFDENRGTWEITDGQGGSRTAQFVVAATGILSVPFIPDIPGRDDFVGEQHHTGLWPHDPVEFAGKRVALIGTGSSGVQIVPAIADTVESLTVFQRTPDWCTPLNNAPITAEEQAELKANFESIREILNTSPSGFLHEMDYRQSGEDTKEQRLAFYEQLWDRPGFSKLTQNYIDITFNPEVNKEFCEFLEGKIRALIDDQSLADKLIPSDHLYAGRRPPFGTRYYEAYNKPNVHLVSLRETPITRLTRGGIETADGEREFDIIIWATGYDFGTGALNRLGVQGRNGLQLHDYWKDGPRTYLGVAAAGFPNFFFPGGPHGALGNNPRYAGDQVDFVMDVLEHVRGGASAVVEVDPAAEEEWTATIDGSGDLSSFLESSYFYGSNIPGKPVKQLLNPTGRPNLQTLIREAIDGGYATFIVSDVSEAVTDA
ncbi:flavin-containing monooxygenase [Gordonia insulae]|uniref:2-oxo-Delta(3)-4,5, 5-trimethylcyclopentenylacetyl-CoA monooxygenase n=1 Tax=Gordonia insulae TaxID=2420509 RepID=A0A3G8JLI6_9ACTN|nr:NAD(P)/FAD-dependent oxidoreductase [Gordonia insulae]AZG45947.1 2-oxo-Delta(3)-4,5,5-trimethylcyclopentenylacetyl-CoA monooxygenase [Gordonia insulae]